MNQGDSFQEMNNRTAIIQPNRKFITNAKNCCFTEANGAYSTRKETRPTVVICTTEKINISGEAEYPVILLPLKRRTDDKKTSHG